MKPALDLQFIQTKDGDQEKFLSFMQKYFYTGEPLSLSINRMPKTPDDCPPLKSLGSGLSFFAINALEKSEDKIVGLVLNEVTKASDSFDELIEKFKTDPFSKTLKLLKKLDDESDIWSRFQIDEIFCTICISVKTEYRGLNIGKKLLEKSLEKAKSLNYSYAMIECSSVYSARISAELGYDLIHQIEYKDYVDENGEVVFKTQGPHTAIKLYVKKI